MTSVQRNALYSPELLALAVELAEFPHNSVAANQGCARSRTCGSEIVLSHEGTDRLERIGMRVSACAVGQAAATIFVREASGKSLAEIAAAKTQIDAWLGGTDTIPEWPHLERLSPALPHSGRHEAILLPWKAALDALSNDAAER